MKKLLLALLLLMAAIPAQAQQAPLSLSNVISKLPALQQGVAYDARNSQVNYITTADILNWKDITLGGGYSSDSKLVATISYDIGGFEKLGINVPLLKYVDLRVGGYVGISDISSSSSSSRNNFSWGPSVTIVSVKF